MMLFENLTKILAFEQSEFPGVRSREDWNIVLAIGLAGERSAPIGFKQLALQRVASPSTLTRSLNRLIDAGIICRNVPSHDGRLVTYSLTKPTLDAFRRYRRLLRNLGW
jgi:DNA-binding MarR family transcriptional regulator